MASSPSLALLATRLLARKMPARSIPQPMAVSTQQAASDRFRELDGLRGIAALAVLLSHYTYLFDVIFPGHTPFPFDLSLGSLGVSLFFMISGFVILMTAVRKPQPLGFAQARAVRLYPTYWASLTITILVVYLSGTSVLYRTPGELAVNYTMLQSFVGVRSIDGAYWSLSREIIFYGIIFLALMAFRHKITDRFLRGLVTVWPAIGLLLCLLDVWQDTTWSHLLVTASAGQFAALFSIGMLMYRTRQGSPTSWLVAPLGVVAAVAEGVMSGSVTRGLVVLLLVAGFVTVTARGSFAPLRWPLLTWLGAISYPLCLLHQNIGYVVILHTVDTVGVWASRLLALAASLALAWMVHELVEVRLSRTINRTIRARQATTRERS